MGSSLRALVEKQLVDDLINYGVEGLLIKFDWSHSCIEGHDAQYLDGDIENFSGILLFSENDNIVAEGLDGFYS